jgi:protein gp37
VSATSSIEWTEKTWNPVRGCSIVSPGCVNCYAMKQAHRFSWPTVYSNPHTGEVQKEGGPYEGLTKMTKAGPQWTGVVRTVESALLEPLSWRKPVRVFVNSMSDLFHEDVPDAFIDRVFAVMALAPRHTFQILTKRAERMRAYFSDLNLRNELIGIEGERISGFDRYGSDGLAPWSRWPLPLKNVWLGVSVEHQHFADERIPLLLQTPAAIRFISAEPLLGPVDLSRFLTPCDSDNQHSGSEHSRKDGDVPAARVADLQRQRPRWDKSTGHDQSDQIAERQGVRNLEWVIVGGESGAGARPFDLAWARSIVQQCKAAGVACFVKQVGAKPLAEFAPRCDSLITLKDRKGGDPLEWPEDLRVREFPGRRAHV